MWELLLAAILAGFTVTGTVEQPEPPPSLSDLPRGVPPRIGYVDHGVWHGTDGARVELPDEHGISAITAYDGGFLVADTRFFEGSLGVVRIADDGRRLGDWASSGGAVLAPDGEIAWASYVEPESGLTGPSLLHRLDACGDVTSVPWLDRQPFSVVAFVGDSVVARHRFLGPTYLVGPSGESARVPHVGVALDASRHLVSGFLGSEARWSGVVDVRSGDLLWRTRGSVVGFSPSGRRVVVSDGRRGWWVARASDGRRLWDLAVPARSYTSEPVWEDERHLLAVTTRGTLAAVLRFGRDGTVERATRVSRSDYHDQAYVLATQP
jgi:hypothetical protein